MKCPVCHSTKVNDDGRSDNGLHKRYACGNCPKRWTDNTWKSDKPVTKFRNKITKSDKYVITAAQNATPVHQGFFKSLEVYCKENNAELVVIPYRYRNPTSIYSDKQNHDEWWAEEVVPFLYSKRRKLNDNIEILGDIKTQPTAVSPLSGLETISRGLSAIIGHAKIQLRVVPSLKKQLPNILTTTGAVTVPNYTDTKTGKKGEFHHSQAACIVEIKGSKFKLRQLNAINDGSFIDENKVYSPKGVTKAPRALALVLGDTHVEFTSKKVEKETFGKGGLVDIYNPEEIIWHDLLDSYSRTHHHKNNPFILFAKHKSEMEDYKKEVERAFAYVCKMTPSNTDSYIVSSNHHDHLYQWMQSVDWRDDPVNAEFYLETALHLVRHAKIGQSGAEIPDPFELWFDRLVNQKNVHYLSNSKSHTVMNIECGLHGHQGFNGSRGSLGQFKKLGTKTITAHGHTPGIEEGAYRVGTSTLLDLEYTKGPSSWLNCHCVIYANGKRSLLFIF